MTDISVDLAGVTLRNPVIPASGTFEVTGMGDRFFDPSELGAVINKTVFLDPRPGNPPPRIYETPCGMLNSIGIPSEGADLFIEKQLPELKSIGVPVIVSVAESSLDRFRLIAEKIEETGMADLLELDLSCPNVAHDAQWSEDPKLLNDVVSAVKEAVTLPVIAKLSPMVPDIGYMGKTAEDAGADALSCINTFRGIAIDIETRTPVLGNVVGGLSGPAIHAAAVYAVYSVYKAVSIPVIGIGGISTWRDAVEFMMAGASAVGVGMYNFVNPRVMPEIIQGIRSWSEERGLLSLRDIIGAAHRK